MNLNFKWKKPHNLFPRAAQAIVIVAVGGLLFAGANDAAVYSAAMESFAAETESLLSAVEFAETETRTDSISEETDEETQAAETDTEIQISEAADMTEAAESETETPETAIETEASPWESLEEELISLTESYSGEWSVYVKDLSNGDIININQQPMESASLIKLYIMGAIMEQINEGILEETDTIDSLLNQMITVSSNEAANELVCYLSESHDHRDGLTYLNSFAERYGFSDTEQVNGLENSSLWHDPSRINRTSARDCGELLSMIYEGTLVSHLASRDMEDLLLAQEVTYKIPSALPDEAVCANKTGEVSDAQNDSAIIYSPGGDFVLCVMSGDWNSSSQAILHIREITRLVYSYFNPSEE